MTNHRSNCSQNNPLTGNVCHWKTALVMSICAFRDSKCTDQFHSNTSQNDSPCAYVFLTRGILVNNRLNCR